MSPEPLVAMTVCHAREPGPVPLPSRGAREPPRAAGCGLPGPWEVRGRGAGVTTARAGRDMRRRIKTPQQSKQGLLPVTPGERRVTYSRSSPPWRRRARAEGNARYGGGGRRQERGGKAQQRGAGGRLGLAPAGSADGRGSFLGPSPLTCAPPPRAGIPRQRGTRRGRAAQAHAPRRVGRGGRRASCGLRRPAISAVPPAAVAERVVYPGPAGLLGSLLLSPCACDVTETQQFSFSPQNPGMRRKHLDCVWATITFFYFAWRFTETTLYPMGQEFCAARALHAAAAVALGPLFKIEAKYSNAMGQAVAHQGFTAVKWWAGRKRGEAKLPSKNCNVRSVTI